MSNVDGVETPKDVVGRSLLKLIVTMRQNQVIKELLDPATKTKKKRKKHRQPDPKQGGASEQTLKEEDVPVSLEPKPQESEKSNPSQEEIILETLIEKDVRAISSEYIQSLLENV